MGSTSCAWRIAEARFRDFRAYRFTIDAEEGREARANLDDVSAKSCGANSVDRSLYCGDDSTASVVFIVLAQDRRRVVHFNVTKNPTAVWAAQQIVEAFPENTAPRYLVRDRDGVYGHHFIARVEGLGVEDIPISARSPWQNCYAERVIGSIRRECLDHVVVINERHLRRILKSYFQYYHRSRTHLALQKDAPQRRPVHDRSWGRIVQIREVGGLHHRYDRVAA